MVLWGCILTGLFLHIPQPMQLHTCLPPSRLRWLGRAGKL